MSDNFFAKFGDVFYLYIEAVCVRRIWEWMWG